MRPVGDLWVWADRASHCLMLGNKAAALEAENSPAVIQSFDPAAPKPPGAFLPFGTYAVPDGPAVALRLSMTPGLTRNPEALHHLLARLDTDRAPDIHLHYAASAEGRRLWRDNALLAQGTLATGTAEGGFSLIFELIRALLDHQPLAAILHGSGLRWRGRTLIFAGASGSGKSTLAALMAAEGAAYLGDDAVPLLAPDCAVHPVPLLPSIKEGAWPLLTPHFPALARAEVLHKGTLRYRILTDAPMAESRPLGPPDLLVLPRYVPDAPPKVVRLSPIEVLLELSRSGLWLAEDQGDLLIDWACSCPAIALRHDGDLGQVEAMMMQALDGALPAPAF